MSRSSSSMSEENPVQEGENVITVELENEDNSRTGKRLRENGDDKEWTIVGKKEKKVKHVEKIELYITSKEKLPKQFAIAKLFKENMITDIERVKYLNPYKIRIDTMNECSAERLSNCKLFLDMGWRIQRPMDKNFSYGVIKSVDLELSEEEILSSIVCPEPGELAGVFRLKRRSSAEINGWSLSECIRLCFKGTFLPPYIFVDGLKVKVDPYVFPVSQCSRCWKLGHTTKRCPSSKIVCPKCGQNHANCEAKSFKCVNCNGSHMALARICPTFLKEKRLREIMAEYNCTYRRALTIYVPSHSPRRSEPKINDMIYSMTCQDLEDRNLFSTPTTVEDSTHPQENSTYANVVRNQGNKHRENKMPHFNRTSRVNKRSTEEDLNDRNDNTYDGEETHIGDIKGKNVTFSELLSRLKDILFLKGVTIQSKVVSILKKCIEWVILVLTESISDWPIIKLVVDYLNKSD